MLGNRGSELEREEQIRGLHRNGGSDSQQAGSDGQRGEVQTSMAGKRKALTGKR